MMIYHTLDLEIDPSKHCALKAGEPLLLRPKTFRLLLVFLAQPGQVLSKQYLLEQVWEGAVVEEQTLFQSISELRKLSDDRSVIKNYPQKGYVWTAEVSAVAAGAKPHPQKSLFNVRAARFLGAVFILVVSVLLVVLLPKGQLMPASEINATPKEAQLERGSIIVLPVENHLADIHYRWLRLGAMDLLIQRLEGQLDYPVMHTEDVLDVLQRAQNGENGDLDNNRLIERIFKVSSAAAVVQLRFTGTPAEFELLYQLHSRHNTRRGTLMSKNVDDSILGLANIVAKDYDSHANNPRLDYATAFANEMLAKGLEYLRSNNAAAAQAYLHNVVLEEPDNLLARRLLAEALFAQGLIDRAQEELTLALAQAEGQPQTQAAELPRLHYWLAHCALANKDNANAQLHARATIATAELIKDDLYRAYGNQMLGEIFIAQGELTSAQHALKLALTDHAAVNCPEGQSIVLLQLAQLSRTEQNAKQAEAYIRQSLNLAENAGLLARRIEGLLELTALQTELGKADLAKTTLNTASALAGNNAYLQAKIKKQTRQD